MAPPDPDHIEMEPDFVGRTDATTDPGHIEMEPDFVGRSESADLTAQAAQMRARLLAKVSNEQAEESTRLALLDNRLGGAKGALESAKAMDAHLTGQHEGLQQHLADLKAKEAQLQEDLPDPVLLAEVREDIAVTEAAITRNVKVVADTRSDFARLELEVADLQAQRDAVDARVEALENHLRSAEAELDKMEEHARHLGRQELHLRNAQEYADEAAAAQARGDDAEATRLRALARDQLDTADMAGRDVAASTYDPQVFANAGLGPTEAADLSDLGGGVDPVAGELDVTGEAELELATLDGSVADPGVTTGADEGLALEEATAFEDAPALASASASAEDEGLAFDQRSGLDDVPAFDESPTFEEVPAFDESPTFEEVPAFDDGSGDFAVAPEPEPMEAVDGDPGFGDTGFGDTGFGDGAA